MSNHFGKRGRLTTAFLVMAIAALFFAAWIWQLRIRVALNVLKSV